MCVSNIKAQKDCPELQIGLDYPTMLLSLWWSLFGYKSTFTILWANLDDELSFLFFPEDRIWHFMQIVSIGDNLQEILKPVFWEK